MILPLRHESAQITNFYFHFLGRDSRSIRILSACYESASANQESVADRERIRTHRVRLYRKLNLSFILQLHFSERRHCSVCSRCTDRHTPAPPEHSNTVSPGACPGTRVHGVAPYLITNHQELSTCTRVLHWNTRYCTESKYFNFTEANITFPTLYFQLSYWFAD